MRIPSPLVRRAAYVLRIGGTAPGLKPQTGMSVRRLGRHAAGPGGTRLAASGAIALKERSYPRLVSTDFERLGRRLVGTWATEATHPALPGTTVGGAAEVQWLEGERFLIVRAHNDHPDFPDAISIVGDTGGLQWHYFDSRGVHRVYEFRVTDDEWEIARDAAPGDAPEIGRDAPAFSQRLTVTFEDDDNTMAGRSKISADNETWEDDLQITYRRKH
jgi:hypothetical protein